MGQRFFVFLLIFSLIFQFSCFVQAEDTSFLSRAAINRELSIDVELLEKLRVGNNLSPVLQCPGVKAEYLEMVARLKEVQERIKSEACEDSKAQDEIEKKMDEIGKLVGEDRKSFVSVVQKGLKPGAEVTDEEAQSIRDYVSAIIKASAGLAGLTKRSTCFDDEKKNITLASLAATVSEVSSTLGAISGPWGAKVKLGGNVVAGLMESVGTIMTARETYCKKQSNTFVGSIQNPFGICHFDSASEQAFVNTLCAYYQLKPDVDELTNPDGALIELTALMRQLDRQLSYFYASYSEDPAIIRTIVDEFMPSLDELPATEPIPEESHILRFVFDSQQTVGVRYVRPPYAEMTREELEDAFQDEVTFMREHYDIPRDLPTPVDYVLRNLRTYAWAKREHFRIQDRIGLEDPDVGLNLIKPEQDKIEQVLFIEEAPKYIKFAAHRAQKMIPSFVRFVSSEYRKVNHHENGIRLQKDPDIVDRLADNPDVALNGFYTQIHELFRFNRDGSPNIKVSDALLESLNDKSLSERQRQRLSDQIERKTRRVKSLRDSARTAILSELKAVKRNYAIFRDYCRLFEFAGLKYTGPVGEACIKAHDDTLAELKNIFWGLIDFTALGEYTEIQNQILGSPIVTTLSDVVDLGPEYHGNWVSALTATLEYENSNFQAYERLGVPSLEPQN